MDDRTTDLNDPSDPSDIPAVLRYAAEKMREQAQELGVAWQDGGAGRPWGMIARELDAVADRIERKL